LKKRIASRGQLGNLILIVGGREKIQNFKLRSSIVGAQPRIRVNVNTVTITFPDREVEKRALAFLIGRFSGRALRSGEHIVPEATLEALADENIPFTVQGKATSG
jgi:hypothetical protein